jgi:hypothetical protein
MQTQKKKKKGFSWVKEGCRLAMGCRLVVGIQLGEGKKEEGT